MPWEELGEELEYEMKLLGEQLEIEMEKLAEELDHLRIEIELDALDETI